ncbi:hypothetical protein P6F26_13265 [Roseibacterium sp. SDUM158017]|uniref:hypothetical protein n=1 Tax=Roseicyclus salinarum TaxID=3036773 RepID=UPI002415191F|nr:hypothetical protein [Roseibacterium sp. SDUM158017]MDG4649408.1 hypothetical protein [Roseibacterium sp. SDUM158017]
MTREQDIIDTLIEESGELYSEAIGADIARDTPGELFHWLIGAIMLSARIGAGNAVEGAAGLREAGLHGIEALREAAWEDVVRVLNEHGYARYDESTARYLRDTARWAAETCSGDLRRLRDAAGGDAGALLKALQGAKGLGPVGADIFAREAQLVWDAFYPSFEGPGRKVAADLGLPQDPGLLAEAAGSRARFVRLVAALTRVALEGRGPRLKDVSS